jgi:hypothetical protein
MAVNASVIKKNFVPVKGPQVAVVFARSGSEGLQGSGNTDRKALVLPGRVPESALFMTSLIQGSCSRTFVYTPGLHTSCWTNQSTVA